MRRLLSFGLLAAVALAAPVALAGDAAFSEAQALTRTDPSSGTDGMLIQTSRGFRVSVCADSGQTLSGAGTLKAWWYHPSALVWMRNPSLDLTVSASSVRCQVFPDQRITAFIGGRIIYAASAVTVSSGTVTVRIDPSSLQP